MRKIYSDTCVGIMHVTAATRTTHHFSYFAYVLKLDIHLKLVSKETLNYMYKYGYDTARVFLNNIYNN